MEVKFEYVSPPALEAVVGAIWQAADEERRNEIVKDALAVMAEKALRMGYHVVMTCGDVPWTGDKYTELATRIHNLHATLADVTVKWIEKKEKVLFHQIYAVRREFETLMRDMSAELSKTCAEPVVEVIVPEQEKLMRDKLSKIATRENVYAVGTSLVSIAVNIFEYVLGVTADVIDNALTQAYLDRANKFLMSSVASVNFYRLLSNMYSRVEGTDSSAVRFFESIGSGFANLSVIVVKFSSDVLRRLIGKDASVLFAAAAKSGISQVKSVWESAQKLLVGPMHNVMAVMGAWLSSNIIPRSMSQLGTWSGLLDVRWFASPIGVVAMSVLAMALFNRYVRKTDKKTKEKSHAIYMSILQMVATFIVGAALVTGSLPVSSFAPTVDQAVDMAHVTAAGSIPTVINGNVHGTGADAVTGLMYYALAAPIGGLALSRGGIFVAGTSESSARGVLDAPSAVYTFMKNMVPGVTSPHTEYVIVIPPGGDFEELSSKLQRIPGVIEQVRRRASNPSIVEVRVATDKARFFEVAMHKLDASVVVTLDTHDDAPVTAMEKIIGVDLSQPVIIPPAVESEDILTISSNIYNTMSTNTYSAVTESFVGISTAANSLQTWLQATTDAALSPSNVLIPSQVAGEFAPDDSFAPSKIVETEKYSSRLLVDLFHSWKMESPLWANELRSLLDDVDGNTWLFGSRGPWNELQVTYKAEELIDAYVHTVEVPAAKDLFKDRLREAVTTIKDHLTQHRIARIEALNRKYGPPPTHFYPGVLREFYERWEVPMPWEVSSAALQLDRLGTVKFRNTDSRLVTIRDLRALINRLVTPFELSSSMIYPREVRDEWNTYATAIDNFLLRELQRTKHGALEPASDALALPHSSTDIVLPQSSVADRPKLSTALVQYQSVTHDHPLLAKIMSRPSDKPVTKMVSWRQAAERISNFKIRVGELEIGDVAWPIQVTVDLPLKGGHLTYIAPPTFDADTLDVIGKIAVDSGMSAGPIVATSPQPNAIAEAARNILVCLDTMGSSPARLWSAYRKHVLAHPPDVLVPIPVTIDEAKAVDQVRTQANQVCIAAAETTARLATVADSLLIAKMVRNRGRPVDFDEVLANYFDGADESWATETSLPQHVHVTNLQETMNGIVSAFAHGNAYMSPETERAFMLQSPTTLFDTTNLGAGMDRFKEELSLFDMYFGKEAQGYLTVTVPQLAGDYAWMAVEKSREAASLASSAAMEQARIGALTIQESISIAIENTREAVGSAYEEMYTTAKVITANAPELREKFIAVVTKTWNDIKHRASSLMKLMDNSRGMSPKPLGQPNQFEMFGMTPIPPEELTDQVYRLFEGTPLEIASHYQTKHTTVHELQMAIRDFKRAARNKKSATSTRNKYEAMIALKDYVDTKFSAAATANKAEWESRLTAISELMDREIVRIGNTL